MHRERLRKELSPMHAIDPELQRRKKTFLVTLAFGSHVRTEPVASTELQLAVWHPFNESIITFQRLKEGSQGGNLDVKGIAKLMTHSSTEKWGFDPEKRSTELL